MMKILSLDCAVDGCSVALQAANEVVSEYQHAPRAHGQLLLPMIERILAQAQVRVNQLDALAFTHGPGSFTGLRIAASMVQALAFSADVPVIGLSTLQVIAQGGWQHYQAKAILVALNAHMHEIYLGAYTLGDNQLMEAVLADCLVKPTGLPRLQQSGFFGLGDAWQVYPSLHTTYQTIMHDLGEDWRPQAETMLPLAEQAYQKNELLSAEAALPVYLRTESAWK